MKIKLKSLTYTFDLMPLSLQMDRYADLSMKIKNKFLIQLRTTQQTNKRNVHICLFYCCLRSTIITMQLNAKSTSLNKIFVDIKPNKPILSIKDELHAHFQMDGMRAA